MFFEINVSKKDKDGTYRHYFATADRSLGNSTKAVMLLKHFQKLFPCPAYDVTVSKHPEQFTGYSPDEFLTEYDKENNIECL
jgi:hypothetical protein